MITQESAASFEQQVQRLERIVEQLERGSLPLAESLSAFEEGMQLVATCKAQLDAVELSVKKVLDAQGNTTPFTEAGA